MLASTVREILSPVLRDCPPACGMVAMTTIDVSSDLSYVTVYISALKEPVKALAFLESRRSELQRKLGMLGTHRTPQLRFRIDRTAEEGDRIDRLLAEHTPDDSSEPTATEGH